MSRDSLKEERMEILGMVAKNIITAEEAEKLLHALENHDDDSQKTSIVDKKRPFRTLKIEVLSSDGDVVNINIPIEFSKLLKSGKFNIDGLDKFDLDIDQIIDMVNSGVVGKIVDIKSADGDFVKIYVD